MKEFRRIFSKVNGREQLKQYAKAHVLLFALMNTALLGVSKKALEIVRLAVNNRIYIRLKKKNQKFIFEYKKNNEFSQERPRNRNIIWIAWLQGMENAPYIVQKCYESMCKNLSDKEIVVVTEENYKKYVRLPDYIEEKYKIGYISKVHFSDLLRVELMATHGGTWIDATVYCSERPKQKYILDSDLFLFQNLKPGLNGHCTAISSWLITASINNPIIMMTRALLHNYWKTHNYMVDYFILHYFFQMSIEAYPEEWNKVVPFNNSTPHILLLRLFEPYDGQTWESVKEQTPFHKLSYKFDKRNIDIKGTYYDILFN